MSEYQRWGKMADWAMTYHRSMDQAESSVDTAMRAPDRNMASIHLSAGLSHLRKALSELKMLRHVVEQDDK